MNRFTSTATARLEVCMGLFANVEVEIIASVSPMLREGLRFCAVLILAKVLAASTQALTKCRMQARIEKH